MAVARQLGNSDVMQLTKREGDTSFVVHFTPANNASFLDGGVSGVCKMGLPQLASGIESQILI